METLVSYQKDVMRVSELGPNSREWGDEMPVASFPESVSVSLRLLCWVDRILASSLGAPFQPQDGSVGAHGRGLRISGA